MTPHLLDCLTQAVEIRFNGAIFAQDLLLDEGAPKGLIDIFNKVCKEGYKLQDGARGTFYFKLKPSHLRKKYDVPAVVGIFSYFKYAEGYTPYYLGWVLEDPEYSPYWVFNSKRNNKDRYERVSVYGYTYYDTPQEAYIDLIKNWYENGIYEHDNLINERDSNDANEDGY